VINERFVAVSTVTGSWICAESQPNIYRLPPLRTVQLGSWYSFIW